MKIGKSAFNILSVLAFCSTLISFIVLPNHPVQAQCTGTGPCNDVQGIGICEIGECVSIGQSYQSGNKAIFRFSGSKDTNFFNVRYKTNNGERQVENRSGSWTISNIHPNRVYSISVQGCVSHFARRSTCSSWSRASVITR